MIPVRIRLLDSSETIVEVNTSTIVKDVVSQVADEVSMSTDDITLTFEGSVLEDKTKVISLGITSDSEMCVSPSKKALARQTLAAAGIAPSSSNFLKEARKGTGEFIDAFIDSGIPFNSTDHYGDSLSQAISCKNAKTVAKLVPYFTFHTMSRHLCQAVGSDLPDILKSVLQMKGIDVNSTPIGQSKNAIEEACSLGSEDMVKLLISAGATPTCAALCASIKSNRNSAISERLLAAEATIACEGANGTTPLHCACLVGDLKMCKLLVSLGSDISSTDREDETPLSLAARSADTGILQFLIEQGASPDTVNCYGETPVYAAVVRGRLEVITMLLKSKAPFDTPTNKGQTPLVKAAELGRHEIFSVLKNAGADVPDRLSRYS